MATKGTRVSREEAFGIRLEYERSPSPGYIAYHNERSISTVRAVVTGKSCRDSFEHDKQAVQKIRSAVFVLAKSDPLLQMFDHIRTISDAYVNETTEGATQEQQDKALTKLAQSLDGLVNMKCDMEW